MIGCHSVMEGPEVGETRGAPDQDHRHDEQGDDSEPSP